MARAVHSETCDNWVTMEMNTTVTIEELDAAGNVHKSSTSHMPRTNVEGSLMAIRAGYNMSRTRIKVDGEIVAEPRRP
jgi:hypothetical protein